MNPYITLLLALVAGILMGAFYFRGLWWTVNRMEHTGRPLAWAAASFLLRTGVVAGGFYLLLPLGWQALAVALLGFLAIRTAALRRWGMRGAPASTQKKESWN